MPTMPLAISLLASVPASTGGAASPDWLGFLAALHPLLVHFPIALVVVGALTEAFGMIRGRSKIGPTAMTAIVIGAIAAALSSWSGWINVDWNGYARDGGTVFVHQWLGLATAGLLAVVLGCALLSRVRESWAWPLNAARWGLLFGAVLVSATAHFGGSLVYGETYLVDALFPDRDRGAPPTAVAREEEPDAGDATTTDDVRADAGDAAADATTPGLEPPVDTAPARVSFVRDVRPILDTHCFKCHGPTGRAKAGIRLHDEATLLAVEFGQAFIAPGSPEDSLVHHVVTLPRDDDMAMPPGGDGLSEAEKATLRRWIEEGASFEESAEDSGDGAPTDPVPADPTPAATDAAETAEPSAEALAAIAAERARVAPILVERGVLVLPLFEGATELVVNASLADPAMTDDDLALLAPFAGDVVELNVARGGITDACAPALAAFTSLERVRLERTGVGDEVARVLATLPALRVANLYATDVGDDGVRALVANASLERIYLWQSRATPEGVADAREAAANPSIRLEGVDPPPARESGEDASDAGDAAGGAGDADADADAEDETEEDADG